MVMLLRSQIAAVLVACLVSSSASAATIGDVCRIKGQESNELRGMGLVVGLNGTGDGDAPTTRALANTMRLLGNPVGLDGKRYEELKNMKNVALVYVTATLPATGVHEGGRVSCQVTATGASSLKGGRLMTTAMVGPRPNDPRVFAVSSGSLVLEDDAHPTAARVEFGTRMIRGIPNTYLSSGEVTLVLDDKHAGFRLANEIEYAINSDQEFKGQELAHAHDAKTVVVKLPDTYKTKPVLFISALKTISLDSVVREKRVVINERTGAIVIGSRVEILPVAVSHKNMTIEIGGDRVNQFAPFNPGADTSTEPLNSLVTALNALRVSSQDKIDILKLINSEGAIYGRLIID